VVVGVIEGIRDVSPDRPSGGQVFWPFQQSARWELTWLVRGEFDRSDLIAAVRREVREVDADLSIATVSSLVALLHAATAEARFVAMLGTIFSGLALGLAAHGLYSVVTYLAVQRFREMGLRMVLGAQANDVLKRVLWKGLQLGALGVALGLVGSVALTRFLESLRYGVSPRDPVTLVAVAALFLLVAVAASLLPALRATRVDPLAMIRS